jgi:HD-like signal output (HDOD) protein
LVGDWKLPEEFESVVAQHHESRRTDGAWDVTELVKVSCAMASTIGFAAFPGCETTPFSDLLEALPARERRHFHGNAETLKKDVAESIHAIESV